MGGVMEFPRKVKVCEKSVWIPLRSGKKLAARIWLPADANSQPVPALLEYLPYRKRDMTRPGDEPKHAWFAGHGYASVHVDMQGAGDSFGVMRDEYAVQELKDGKGVIAWLAKQPWCTGKVGMFGISWGGFNSLQVAALNPPALKAIVTSCSTDDRYTSDMHYAGGCLLNDNLGLGHDVLFNPGAARRSRNHGAGLAQELAGAPRRHPPGRAVDETPAARRLLETRIG